MNNHFVKRGRNQRRRQGGGPNPNRALDSNGPDVRIRGTAQQIYDKYQALARDAQSSDDRVKAENYLQHAEHYFRVLRATQGSPPVSQFDQNEDRDGDADQPGPNEGRDQRHDRTQQNSFSTDETGDGDQGGDDQPEIPSYGGDRPMEPQQEQRVQNNNGGQHGGGANGGDHESRRRRRRPRRPREDGAPAEIGEAIDEPDPAPAS